MSVLAVSCVMEKAPPAHSTTTSFSRVGSPKAAKTLASASLDWARVAGVAMPAGRALTGTAFALRGDMANDVLHLDGPALAVHPKGLQAAARRHFVEAGLDYRQPRRVS